MIPALPFAIPGIVIVLAIAIAIYIWYTQSYAGGVSQEEFSSLYAQTWGTGTIQ